MPWSNNYLPDTAPAELPPVRAPAPGTLTPRPPKRRRGKIALVLFACVLLIGAGAAGAWFVFNKKQATTPSNSSGGTPDSSSSTATLSPVTAPTTIAYSFTDGNVPIQLYTRPVAGGDRTAATKLADKETISLYGTHGSKAFVVTYTTGGSGKANIWYSSDSGKTYNIVFSGNASTGNNYPDQITSAVFSNDGNSIAFGFLPTGSTQNTVKELNPGTKTTNDLFSLESQGVFVYAYDAKTKDLIYARGCYNCDGGSDGQIRLRNLGTNNDTTIFDDQAKLTEAVAVNPTLSKILVLTSTPGQNALGGGAPYNLQEVTVSTKAAAGIYSSTSARPLIGYTANGTPYYTMDTQLSSVGNDGKPTVIYEAAKPIQHVIYVGKDTVIASSGQPNDFTLTNYNPSTKTSATILSGDSNTILIGAISN